MGELLHLLAHIRSVPQRPDLHEVIEAVAEGRRHIDQLLESGDQLLDVLDIGGRSIDLYISFCTC